MCIYLIIIVFKNACAYLKNEWKKRDECTSGFWKEVQGSYHVEPEGEVASGWNEPENNPKHKINNLFQYTVNSA